MHNLFVSNDNKSFIVTFEGIPCFIRTTHEVLAREKGLNLGEMNNKTFDFWYNGQGESIKSFLNNSK